MEIRLGSIVKKWVVVGINIIIAALHLINADTLLADNYSTVWTSYASDFLIPFGFYYLLCLPEREHVLIRPWYVKAGIIFTGCSVVEAIQYFNIPFLGSTFDPYDFMAYGAGLWAAILLEKWLFIRVIKGWKNEEAPNL